MDVSTVVFAILAIFVIWKLRSVLGTRTGSERPPSNPFLRRDTKDANAPPPDGQPRSNVVDLPGAADRAGAQPAEPTPEADRWKGFAEPGSAVAAGLDAIQQADPSFTAESFLQGARVAYEHILLAFAKGDRAALEGLLASDVLDGFTSAMAARESRGETVETTFVGIGKALMEEAQLKGGTAQIAVRFDTQLINLTRDRAGTVIDGSPDRVSNVIDLWTFARDLASRNPNWRLVATGSGQ